MAAPHFLVHEKSDSVGIVVVEGIEKGQSLTGWVMDTDGTMRIKCTNAIPLGHKIALGAITKDATVIKYGHDIGKATAAIGKGAHVHVHNLKTKRW